MKQGTTRFRMCSARAAAAIAIVCGLQVMPAVAAAPKAKSHTVVIDAMAFSPSSLTVSAGDKVTWVNKDPFPHTATAQGAFDSGVLQPNAKWTYTAKKRGQFPYICTLHPTMKGMLIVK